MRTPRIVMIMTIVLLATAVGCNNNQRITAWGLTAPDSDVNMRMGLTVGENAEMCAEMGWNSSSFNSDGTPDRVGGVFIYHLTQEISWEDTPTLSPIADILNSLQARPYVGLGCMVDRGDQRLEAKWVAGTTFADSPDMPWAFMVEYQDSDGLVTSRDDSAVFVGVRLRF